MGNCTSSRQRQVNLRGRKKKRQIGKRVQTDHPRIPNHRVSRTELLKQEKMQEEEQEEVELTQIDV